MAKTSKGMVGDVSPRKEMAGAKMGGNFGVRSFSDVQGGVAMHPDASAKTGQKGHMADHERGIGMPVAGAKGHHPAQAAPDHGPVHGGNNGGVKY